MISTKLCLPQSCQNQASFFLSIPISVFLSSIPQQLLSCCFSLLMLNSLITLHTLLFFFCLITLIKLSAHCVDPPSWVALVFLVIDRTQTTSMHHDHPQAHPQPFIVTHTFSLLCIALILLHHLLLVYLPKFSIPASLSYPIWTPSFSVLKKFVYSL